MDTPDALKKQNLLEDHYVTQKAAALHILLAVSSPKGEQALPEDTSCSIFFELLFELISPIGLLANLASIIFIAEKWLADSLTQVKIPDVW